jgi:hypothetical protein
VLPDLVLWVLLENHYDNVAHPAKEASSGSAHWISRSTGLIWRLNRGVGTDGTGFLTTVLRGTCMYIHRVCDLDRTGHDDEAMRLRQQVALGQSFEYATSYGQLHPS